MALYYFVVSALPKLVLGKKPELSFQEFKELLALNLTKKDLHLVELLLRPIDLYNIRALWQGFPLDERGNFNGKELEEAILVRDFFPDYLIEYLGRYETTADRLRYFPSLYASLYREGDEMGSGFLSAYFQMEREIRLVLTALRAKRAGRDIVRELQFEDPSDPFVAQILAQKDAPDYIPPREYEDLKARFLDNVSDPEKLGLAVLQYRFEKIEEMEETRLFSIDQILGYMARLLIVETWNGLDKEKGHLVVEQLSQYG